jgi:uncharacterized protein with FMN-binding domain
MKKILISLGIVVIFVGYVVYQHLHGSSSVAPTTVVAPTQTNQTAVSQTPPTSTSTADNPPAQATSTPAPTPIPTPPPVAQGQYKDGSYTGTVADAFYGKLQVVAVIQNGKIADVQFPVFPNSPGHTTQVSQEALPQLKSEAIAAQSANVDIVSGATQDSQAFQQSLASALAQAKS